MFNKAGRLNPAEWIHQYGDFLYSLALIKVGNKENAEDIVQETFLSAFKAKDSFRNDSSEKTWLIAILKNKITDYYRKKDVLENITSYMGDTEPKFDNSFFNREDGHWIDSARPQQWDAIADTKINRDEFNKILQYCIQKMPAKLVPVFVAKFLEEETAEIICKEFNISSSNYWVILLRDKVLIRSCLEKNWFLN